MTNYGAAQIAQHNAIMNYYQNAGTNAFTTATGSPGTIFVTVPAGTTTISLTQNQTSSTCPTITSAQQWAFRHSGHTDYDITVHLGEARLVHLPDGTTIDVKADGNFSINDKDAKVTYRSNRVREFNSYLNASDKLEAFIKFCGTLGIKQDQMLDMPIKAFIGWLVVEAAAADGENTDYKQLAAELRTAGPQPRDARGRFIRRTK